MSVSDQQIPIVMSFAGADPTGGAGIQADIEAILSMGCHTAPVITAITVQDTQGVKDHLAIQPGWVIAQARAVLEDMAVGAFRIGMLGSVNNVEAVHSILVDYSDIPVVLDPTLGSESGQALTDGPTLAAIQTLLFPQTTVLVITSREARNIAPEADTLEACAQQLMDQGCELVLLTGVHEPTPQVINVLYGNLRVLETFTWERLTETYHGAGSTLAASIAGLLAQGLEPLSAVHEAQEYTWETLKQGYRLGMGRWLPNRLFWAHDETEEP
jgi:hydroxymethylpyrimidine/phosphomethylpyrimidine kinase